MKEDVFLAIFRALAGFGCAMFLIFNKDMHPGPNLLFALMMWNYWYRVK